MKLRQGLAAVALAVAGVLTVSGCAGGSGDSGDNPKPSANTEFKAGTTMAKLHDAGKMTVGTKFDQPLFGLVDLEGNPQGFDVEIAKIIAADLGISADKIKWVETVSKNREPFIQNGTVDIVVATYTINDERKKVVSFAGPYYIAGQDLLVLKGNPEGIKSVEDVKGKPVCTVSGSTSLENIKEYTDNIITTDTYSNCLEPLRNGKVVAVTTDNVILAGLADKSDGEFELVEKPFTQEPYGIGLAHDDDEFRDFINDSLEKAFKDGSWAKAWEKTAGKVLKTPEPPTLDRY